MILIRSQMHANTVVFGQAQQTIDNFKTWVTIRPVNARNFHQLLIRTFVAQLDHAFDQGITLNVYGNFAICFFYRNHMLTKRF